MGQNAIKKSQQYYFIIGLHVFFAKNNFFIWMNFLEIVMKNAKVAQINHIIKLFLNI